MSDEDLPSYTTSRESSHDSTNNNFAETPDSAETKLISCDVTQTTSYDVISIISDVIQQIIIQPPADPESFFINVCTAMLSLSCGARFQFDSRPDGVGAARQVRYMFGDPDC